MDVYLVAIEEEAFSGANTVVTRSEMVREVGGWMGGAFAEVLL